MRLLVTGGAGFIGSNFIHHILDTYSNDQILNVDALTYAGNLENLADIANDGRYQFVHANILDQAKMIELAKTVDVIVNFAAESHVDRSIQDPTAFIRTDVEGTYSLIQAARQAGHTRFLQVSTDEVYGDFDHGGSALEDAPLKPSSPYAASKAAGDLQVLAAHRTFGFPGMITRCTNNYGPNHYPEKIIPLFITNAIENLPLPVYGNGQQIRDWLYVRDHCAAIDLVLHQGKPGEIYNIGANQSPEVTNLALTKHILQILQKPESLIKYVSDRPGHDVRYAVNSDKIRAMGWKPSVSFDDGLAQTIEWFIKNEPWWRKIKSGEYKQWYQQQYVTKTQNAGR